MDAAEATRRAREHESRAVDRDRTGTFYTPPELADWLLDRALPETGVPSVCDPSCGAGNVLAAVVERLVARGVAPREAVRAVHGVDLDAEAVELCRVRCSLAAPGTRPDDVDIRVGDGLAEHPGAPYDVIVGNPPFLGRLKRRTSTIATGGLGAYTDASAVFLHRSLELVRPGGVVALVQPISLLAARDAGAVRDAVVRAGALTDLFVSDGAVFPDATVHTCVPVVRVGERQGQVRVWQGDDVRALPLPAGEWGPLAAAGVPQGNPRTDGVLGDVASCTADFRDQYYGLVGHVREGGPGRPPLITSGLIDPAVCRWGTTPTRFAKERFEAPTVDVAALAEPLRRWAADRLVPKVLVATQGRVIEAVVDEHGAWLPSVPVITVQPDPARLWHVLAVLCAPPVVAAAAARYHGTALSPSAIKLSARQIAALPLPAHRDAWDLGADLARAAQHSGEFADLIACGEQMCAAYGDHAALDWWAARCDPRHNRQPKVGRDASPT